MSTDITTVAENLLNDPQRLREMAVAACVYPDTLKAFLRGHAVRSTTRTRIERALANVNTSAPAAERPRRKR